MPQEKLSGLALISFENNLVVKLEYKDFISNFASQKVNKINFN